MGEGVLNGPAKSSWLPFWAVSVQAKSAVLAPTVGSTTTDPRSPELNASSPDLSIKMETADMLPSLRWAVLISIFVKFNSLLL